MNDLAPVFVRLIRDWPKLQYGSATQRREVYGYIRGLAQPHGKYDEIFNMLLTMAIYYVKELEHVSDDF